MIIGLIPSRLNSKRLKNKPLLKIDGLPIVVHTFKRAKLSKKLDDVIVCADDEKIVDVVKKHGGKALLTSKNHKNGTERIFEVAKKIKKTKMIIDIQGDEPLVDPKDIDRVIDFHKKNSHFDIVVPCMKANTNINSRNLVKVVFSENGKILYFSRAQVPFDYKDKKINYYRDLSIVSFIESSFFPIPPDVMIIPMSLAKKEEYLKIFFIATLFSSLGGLFGYFIGSLFTDKAIMIMEFYGYEEQVLQLKNQLNSKSGAYSLWLGTLFLAGFTPLPFKIFTITSGIINFNIFTFFVICLISRGLRFFIVAYFSVKFGKPFVTFLEKKGGIWFSVAGIVIILMVLLVYLIFR